jgi:hypothetical protein
VGRLKIANAKLWGATVCFKMSVTGNYKLREGKGSGLGEPFSCKDDLQRKCQ